MGVTHRPDKPDGTAELKKELREVKAAGDSTAALLSLSFKAQIVQDRAAGTGAISDEMILASAAVVDYPEFIDNHAYNTVGEIIKAGVVVDVKSGLYYSYKGAVYKAAGDMPNCVYPPDTPGMWQWERVERG